MPEKSKSNTRSGLTPGSLRGAARRVIVQRAPARIPDADFRRQRQLAGIFEHQTDRQVKGRNRTSAVNCPDQPCSFDLAIRGRTAFSASPPSPCRFTDRHGGLPADADGEVAGRMAIPGRRSNLENSRGGSGVLLSGVPSVAPARILGGGVVGGNAALIAIGLGADVTIIDRSLERLRSLRRRFGQRLRTLHLTGKQSGRVRPMPT